jgi:hypothetical protein
MFIARWLHLRSGFRMAAVLATGKGGQRMAPRSAERSHVARAVLLRQHLHHPAALGALALDFVEDLFVQAEVLGRGFGIFVRADVFEGVFKAPLQGRFELDAFAVLLQPHVGEVFGLAGIHWDVVRARVLAHDHAPATAFARERGPAEQKK